MTNSLNTTYKQLRNGDIRAADLLENCEASIDASEHDLNAYKTLTADRAGRAAAAADACFSAGAEPGPLAGMPVSIKDLFAIDGLPTFAGSAMEIPGGHLNQGPIVSRLINQLCVIPGKTHTVEFAFGGLGFNSHWGTPVNPWDADHHRVPGGSSAGAGVSLCQGSALLALGTDTAGSVRIPASMTGNVGLKTSKGRWSTEGIFPLSPTLDTPGILTRTVEDCAFAFASLDTQTNMHPGGFLQHLQHSADESAPVIGVDEAALWDHAESDIADAVSAVLQSLQSKGATLKVQPLPQIEGAQNLLRQGNVVAAEIAEYLQSNLEPWLDQLDPVVGSRIRDGGSISASEWLGRLRQLQQLSSSADAVFEHVDVIASPTVPISPPTMDDIATIENYRSHNIASLLNTCGGNSLGLCAITLPVALDRNGMPVGLQLMARHSTEEKLLTIALWIEQQIGTSRERLGTPPRVKQA